MDSLPLAQLQRLLLRLIAAPEGVAAGLRELTGAQLGLWSELAAGAAGMPMSERLDIYANMYFFRLRDSLAEDYPAVAAVLGPALFHNLVTDYLLVHPPSHYSLRYAGQWLAAFLEPHGLTQESPFLADLARFEWAILSAFDASDAPVLSPTQLATLPAEVWGDLHFTTTPSLQLLTTEWPVHQVWQAVQRGEVPAHPAPATTHLRIWRQDLRVFHRAISAGEMHALQQLKAGSSFADVCAAVADSSAEAAAAVVAGHLSCWVADGLLSACSSAVAPA